MSRPSDSALRGKQAKRADRRRNNAREAIKKALAKARFFKAIEQQSPGEMHLPPA